MTREKGLKVRSKRSTTEITEQGVGSGVYGRKEERHMSEEPTTVSERTVIYVVLWVVCVGVGTEEGT